MTEVTPTRRALVDLPINTFGTPLGINNLGKAAINHKRPIDAVTQPEYPRHTPRSKMSPHRSQIHQKGEMVRTEIDYTVAPKITSPTESIIPDIVADKEELAEEVGDGDSQHSYVTNVDFDPDDTMVSQQTAATEFSQPLLSTASQHAETLRLRLRLAHFKVRTNQTHIPLSRLQTSTTEAPGSSPAHEPSLPKLLPPPILKPTAYSSRTFEHNYAISSPPSSPDDGSGKIVHEEVFRTPALPRHSIRQTSSPPSSQERVSQRERAQDDRLTSSAVRGKAAIGLLGLRQER